ncbi:MAG TPA: mannitol-1-phosphate 5-dehydrogenase [Armatimonadota bacterium]|nr:mannitol-1-phosphate 5-dehydrogenase [Armatimonadota bacterium]
MKLVQFGAGNIGRAFVGQLFAQAGWEVVFADIDEALVAALNRARSYIVEIRDEPPGRITVRNVRAVNGGDRAAVAAELATADAAATAVGAHALNSIYPLIAAGLVRRRELRGGPLDILICENLHDAANIFRAGLAQHLPADFDLAAEVGLIETSIGKMVPLVAEEERRRDPLTVHAEAFNTLIVDGRAFKRPVPAVPGLDAKDHMAAYVHRKLFIHNLGHVAAAYLGFVAHPERSLLWQALADSRVLDIARGAMWESGRALIAAYPAEFDRAGQGEHIEDLLRRFRNRRLGDTVYRVGRDLYRKLGPGDRVVGALRLQMRHDVPPQATATALAAGLLFSAVDESGRRLPEDERFAAAVQQLGPGAVLTDVCGLDPRDCDHAYVLAGVPKLYDRLRSADTREATLDEFAAASRAAVSRIVGS